MYGWLDGWIKQIDGWLEGKQKYENNRQMVEWVERNSWMVEWIENNNWIQKWNIGWI